MAQYALQLLLDNEFDLNRDHFDILISTSANNGDLNSVIEIMNVMNAHNIEATQSTLNLIFECFERHFLANKYDSNRVDIHSLILLIQNRLFSLCNITSMAMQSEYFIKFMEWYCEFGDVQNAFSLHETISFEKHALKSNICQKMAILQISLLFKNKINLSKAIGLLQNEILQMNDNSLYALFAIDAKGQIMPKLNTSRRIFMALKETKNTNWCNVNVLNLLLHIAQISGDLHNGCYILHELYLQHMDSGASDGHMAVIEPNHNTMNIVSKLFQLSQCSDGIKSIQPRTIEWSIKIYEWLLFKYKDNEFILEMLKETTQHLLRLTLHDLDNIDNVKAFCTILQAVKCVIDDFEADPKLFGVLGRQTVANYVKMEVVMERSVKVYGYMVMTRDGSEGSNKITSVADRARLLGAILKNFDRNICKMYREQIGGPKQSYFQIRRDLQQQLVQRLHREYSLNDILTLDVLKLTQTKPVQHTTAFTQNKGGVNV